MINSNESILSVMVILGAIALNGCITENMVCEYKNNESNPNVDFHLTCFDANGADSHSTDCNLCPECLSENESECAN